MKSRKWFAFVLAMVLLAVQAGFAGAEPALSKVVLSKTELALEVGETASIAATAVYTDGTTANVTVIGDWSSDNSAVASVYNGTVTAKGVGVATIVFIYQNEPQSVQVTVSKKVKALTKDKQSLDLRRNGTADIALTALYDDNTSEDVTQKAEWSVDDASVASVVNGTVTGQNPGTATVTAKYGKMTVTIPVSVEVVRRLDPDKKQISLLLLDGLNKDQETVKLIATYPDGTTRDVAAEAQWSSSNEAVADAINGVVTAYGPGKATLTASYGTKTATIEVDVDTTRKLDVDSQSVFLRLSGDASAKQKQLKLTATYPDGTTADVTGSAKWSSSNESVAYVSNGLIGAVSAGSAVVTAQYGDKSIAIDVDVEVPRLLVLQSGADPVDGLSMKAGDTRDLTLTATFANGTTDQVTDRAKWTSSNEDVVYVGNGQVRAFKMGEANVTASYGGKTVSIPVDVDIPRKLSAGDIKTISLKLDEEYSIPLTAVYADGSEVNVADKADWSTSAESVAKVEKGVVTGVATGTATITAKYGTRTLTLKVEVNQAGELTPDTAFVALSAGQSRQIVLNATVAGSTMDVAADAEWKSSSPQVADVSKGLIRAYKSGKATITAQYGGKTATIAVEVDLLKKLDADRHFLSAKSGDKVQIKLTATYGDGSERDVTADAEWKSGSYKVADVSGGLVTAIAYGKTNITAKYGGKTVTIPVDVDTLKYLQTNVVSLTLKAGTKKQATAVATYADGSESDVTKPALWTSSNPMVADVKDGIIRANGKGKAVITVSYAGKKAKIAVTVE